MLLLCIFGELIQRKVNRFMYNKKIALSENILGEAFLNKRGYIDNLMKTF